MVVNDGLINKKTPDRAASDVRRISPYRLEEKEMPQTKLDQVFTRVL